MQKCERCGNKGDTLRVCQTPKHRKLGKAFCSDCSERRGGRFNSPYICQDCHSEPKQEHTRAHRRTARHKPRTRHDRLVRLRKSLQYRKDEMAMRLGISLRQYHQWEKDEANMPKTAKLLCHHISVVADSPYVNDWKPDLKASMPK